MATGTRLWRYLAAMVLTGALLVAAWLVVPHDGRAAEASSLLLFIVLSAMAGIASWGAATRGPGPARRPWRWIAGAFLSYVVVQAVIVASASMSARAAGPVTVGSALSIRMVWALVLLVGILTFPMTPLTGGQRLRMVADLTTVLGGGFLVVWYFLLAPALAGGPVGVTAIAAIGYPIADLVLIFGVCVLLMRGGVASLRGPLPVFLAGLLIYLAVDFTFARQLVNDGPLNWDTGLALAVFVADLVMAAAAVIHTRQPGDGTAPAPGQAVAAAWFLPYLALFAGYSMLVVAVLRDGALVPWGGLVAGVIVMTGAVVLRQILAMRENQVLIVRDHLTGLANRRSVDAAVDAAVRRHRQDGQSSAILLIDLDDFKAVNDTRGHDAGDALLVAFAEVLRRNVRGGDVAGRVGGDEFLMVLDRVTEDGAMEVAARIVRTAADPVVIGDAPATIRASIGVAMTDPEDGAAGVRRRADLAMYAAKRRGRHDVELWQPALRDEAAGRV